MLAHVAFVPVAAANLASHAVIKTTVDHLLITLQLVATSVGFQGRAIFLDEAPGIFVKSLSALLQILAFVAFQECSFYSHLQCHYIYNTSKLSLIKKKRNKVTYLICVHASIFIRILIPYSLLLLYSSLKYLQVSV